MVLLRRLAFALPMISMAPMLACGPSSGEPDLEGRVFLSQSVTENGTPRALVSGTRLRLDFMANDQASGSAGCNSINGHYTTDGGIFDLGPEVSMTLIGCSPEVGDQEDWYFEFLTSEPEITVDGDALTLEGDGTRIEYLDQEVATPDEALTDTVWTVDTILQGGTATHAQWPTPATLVFGTDGTVDVQTGCNSGSGSYLTSGAELTFLDVAVTERGCADPLATGLETGVLAVVHGPQPVTWEITANRLSLRGANGGLDLLGSEG